ncbi:MAG: sensor histidine kinase [Tannerellaceae bacterium]|jgi:signal transduction histidine kinase|nr:sensor histidine kinase [Tannerellaceae bacterium]
MKKAIYLLLFLSPLVLPAQTNVDSLIDVSETKKLTVNEQLELYDKISRELAFNDTEKSAVYSRKGLALAEKEKNLPMASRFNEYIGVSFNFMEEVDSSIIYLEQALDLAVKAKDINQETKLYVNLGVSYQSYDRIKALDYYQKALDLCDKIDNKNYKAMILANIGSIHLVINNKRAIHFLEQARDLAEEIDFKQARITAYCHLASIYSVENDHDKALEYGWKTVELCKETGNKNFQSSGMAILASTYYELQEYAKALECVDESLKLADELGDPSKKYDALMVLSEIYLKEKRYKDSETIALQVYQEDSISTRARGLSFCIGMSNIFMGNKEKASYYFWKYNELSRELNEQKYDETLMDLEAIYETEKKEIHIAALEKDKKLYDGLGAASVTALLLGMGLFFYRHRSAVQKRKLAEQQIKQLEQEKELIAARSALDAEKVERETIARDLHDGVGAMLSVVKNNMNIMKSYSVIENKEAGYFNKALDGLDKSIVELRRVAHHIMPAILVEKGLAPALDDFCRSVPEAEFHHSEPERRFDPEKELVLYRCAYELVSNALRHAGASRIEVHFNMDKETAYLSVVDNGCGFDPQASPQGMGIGIKNLHTRLSAFGGSIDIYSEPGKGTEANVELKV